MRWFRNEIAENGYMIVPGEFWQTKREQPQDQLYIIKATRDHWETEDEKLWTFYFMKVHERK